MLPSCALCSRSDPQRMIALMGLWFGRYAGLPAEGGYFYLCPSCYAQHVEPDLEEILNRLVEQHPFLHRLRGDHELATAMPLRQAGALPVPHDPAPATEARSPASPLPPDAAA